MTVLRILLVSYMPGTGLSNLHVLSSLMLITILINKKETEA